MQLVLDEEGGPVIDTGGVGSTAGLSPWHRASAREDRRADGYLLRISRGMRKAKG